LGVIGRVDLGLIHLPPYLGFESIHGVILFLRSQLGRGHHTDLRQPHALVVLTGRRQTYDIGETDDS